MDGGCRSGSQQLFTVRYDRAIKGVVLIPRAVWYFVAIASSAYFHAASGVISRAARRHTLTLALTHARVRDGSEVNVTIWLLWLYVQDRYFQGRGNLEECQSKRPSPFANPSYTQWELHGSGVQSAMLHTKPLQQFLPIAKW